VEHEAVHEQLLQDVDSLLAGCAKLGRLRLEGSHRLTHEPDVTYSGRLDE
jgi:hypothetical protein